MSDSEKGTFIIEIQGTSNATWQGTVTWADRKIQKNFRSTLELLKMIDSAVTENAAPKENITSTN